EKIGESRHSWLRPRPDSAQYVRGSFTLRAIQSFVFQDLFAGRYQIRSLISERNQSKSRTDPYPRGRVHILNVFYVEMLNDCWNCHSRIRADFTQCTHRIDTKNPV